MKHGTPRNEPKKRDTLVLGPFPDGHFPDGQFPEGQFPKRTISQMNISRTGSSPNDISPNWHFPKSHFFIYLGWLFLLKIRRHELWLDLDMLLNISVTKNWRSFWWTETYSLRVIKDYFKNHLCHKSRVFITSLINGNHKLKLFGISFSRI